MQIELLQLEFYIRNKKEFKVDSMLFYAIINQEIKKALVKIEILNLVVSIAFAFVSSRGILECRFFFQFCLSICLLAF